ncbi:hypothetical protein GWK16_22210 [Roseomonas sp. JC162]|uniref:Uncharacterized protein n=1 Tax=Neoroseomonas marina TaxID=1232220 RepID=A0A848EKT3_9PROT|nr:hypothetical protein [Neoroseomonas marina]NMJ43978.1 hypothetical protein [Neoroseomonas marina]
MTDALPYAVEQAAASKAETTRMRKRADEMDGGGRTHFGIAPVVLIIFAALGLLDYAFGIIDTASWIVLIVGSMILLIPAAIIHRRGAAESERVRQVALALRRDAKAGCVQRHTLHRDARHWFVEHEHGVMHLSPAGPGRTLFLDLSSVSDDPRHDGWYAKRRIDRDTWRWTSAADGAVLLFFAAEGAPVAPNSFAAALGREDSDLAAAIFEAVGSPGDGDIIPRDFAEIDADLRARIAAAKAT